MRKFIGWIDEPSGELNIDTINIDDVNECLVCGEGLFCECSSPAVQVLSWEIDYPGFDRKGQRCRQELEIDNENFTGSELERRLREAKNAAWEQGDILFISDSVDEIHAQHEALIAEAEAAGAV